MTSTTDPMGNVETDHFDANHNLVSTRTEGELIDVVGSTSNVRLSEAAYEYDDMDRLIRMEVEFFDTDTQAPIQGGQQLGKSIVEAEYSDNSQVIRVIDDNLHDNVTIYDTANRESVVTDAKSNTVEFTYDENSNVTNITEVEKSDLGDPDETYMTNFEYDNLDRLIVKLDAIGNRIERGYDSRDNFTLITDARDNETRHFYDGNDRHVQTIIDMDGDGADGNGTDITTAETWDDSSRITEQIDDNGNILRFDHDSLDRVFKSTYADGTEHSRVYDVHDNKLTSTDANGSVTTQTYDLLDRLIGRTIVPGPGVSNEVTFEIYQYYGSSRLVHVEDDDSLVTYRYDSLGRTTREILDGETLTTVFDGVGNMIECTYPGGRTITNTYDELDRKKTVSDTGGLIASYDYFGPSRIQRREFANGTRTEYEYDGILPNPPGDFGRRKIIRTKHSVIASGNVIDERTYTWDRMMNKAQRKDVRAGGPQLTHDYEYDPAHRLINTVVTNAAAAVIRDIVYDLDGVGNRSAVSDGPDAGTYTLDPTLPEPADLQSNQYTSTATDLRSYDKNGNLTVIAPCCDLYADVVPAEGNCDVNLNDLLCILDGISGLLTCPGVIFDDLDIWPCDAGDGDINLNDLLAMLDALRGLPGCPNPCSPGADLQLLKYNYRNQVVEINNLGTGQRHVYTYDAIGRRIVRITDADGSPVETRYFRDGTHVIEEQDGAGNTNSTYAFGEAIDEILMMRRGGNDYYYHADQLLNIMAVTDASGNVVERYDYQDYGMVEFRDVTGHIILPIKESAIGNPFPFNTRRYDPETGWLCYRTRFMDPTVGRFTTRDTIGIWGDASNLGNAYAYVGNNPTTYIDPFGLEKEEPQKKEKSAVEKLKQKIKKAVAKAREIDKKIRKKHIRRRKEIPKERKGKTNKEQEPLDEEKKRLKKEIIDLNKDIVKLFRELAEELKKDKLANSDEEAEALLEAIREELDRFKDAEEKKTAKNETEDSIKIANKELEKDKKKGNAKKGLQKRNKSLRKALRHLFHGDHAAMEKGKPPPPPKSPVTGPEGS